ncbi:MAG: cysteine hydrolase [Burkholderiales bacterium]|nr:cysteine hydrolase [Burkholderiales bacterium]
MNPNSALILLDLQNDMVSTPPQGVPSPLAKVAQERGVVPAAARVLAAFRSAGRPVFHVRLGFRPDYADSLSVAPRIGKLKQARTAIVGTWGTEFPPELQPADGEIVITKACVNPFFNTALLSLLHKRGVQEVVLGGVATHMAVESTARYADDAGFAVTVLEDCCAVANPDWHRHSVQNMLPLFGRVVSSSEFLG